MKKASSIKNSLRSLKWYKFPLLTLAGIISSLGITAFLQPAKLYDNGIAGTSMFLADLTPPYLSLPLFLLVLNIPLILYGLKEEGLVFTIYSCFAVTMFSISTHIVSHYLITDTSAGSPVVGYDRFLCCIFGGLIVGCGSGLAIRLGGALDGIEVIAVTLSEKLGLNLNTFLLIYNVALYLVCGIVLGDWTQPLYSIVAYVIALKVIDYIIDGFDKNKAILIVTDRADEISQELSEEFHQGLTLINAKGYYSGQDKTLIHIIVNRFQIITARDIIQRIDPKAYISVSDISDIFKAS